MKTGDFGRSHRQPLLSSIRKAQEQEQERQREHNETRLGIVDHNGLNETCKNVGARAGASKQDHWQMRDAHKLNKNINQFTYSESETDVNGGQRYIFSFENDERQLKNVNEDFNQQNQRLMDGNDPPVALSDVNNHNIVYQNDRVTFQHKDLNREVDRNEGPFVFGVHSPSHFLLRRFNEEDCMDGRQQKYVNDKNSCDIRYNEGNQNSGSKKEKLSEQKKKKSKVSDRRRKSSNRRKQKIKCLLVGDGAVGKTSLITSYAKNLFEYEYKPTAFDNYNVDVEVDQRPVNVEICDTAGQDSLDGLRELCYPGTDVIILCFSVVKPDSFRSVASRWAPAVAGIRAPLILVGTQGDLRDNHSILTHLKLQGEAAVTESEALLLGNSLSAPYIETSAKNRTKLKDAFDAAILAALPKDTKTPVWRRLLCLA